VKPDEYLDFTKFEIPEAEKKVSVSFPMEANWIDREYPYSRFARENRAISSACLDKAPMQGKSFLRNELKYYLRDNI
jgi:hypothetical protein